MRKMVGTVAVVFACVHSLQAKTPTVVLQTPERVYAGETFTAKLVYQSQNTENPLPAPIFEVVSTGQLFHVSGNTYTNRAWILGLSTNAVTPGILAKKEKGEISFSVTAGSQPVVWNVILHEAGQGGDNDPFPLDRLFSAERLARGDGVVEILRDNIGRTWGKFYTKFGNYLENKYLTVYADFWKTASVFAETVYFNNCREALSPLPSLTQAAPVSGKVLTAASCSHRSDKSMPKELSNDPNGSYDGTIWLYCPSCTTWKLCLKGAFGTSPEIYETLDWSQPVYVITIDSKSVTTQNNYGKLAAALLGKGTVLGACWTHGGNKKPYAENVDHSADTVARHLKLLGADPTKITFIGTGYGAHVAANAIALYENDSGDARPFARLAAIDPLTTDYGILAESAQASSNLFLRASSKCSLIDLYRASWSRSLTHADQLFG
ncbi:MAG: hypothetical protein J5985_03625, partial [Kiritimatiellae bacterium]|nr:hypothetical protein [Kiritimatiellia bacterium]